MRDDMPVLAEIDMGAVNIAAYAADGEAANSIPYKAFYNGTNGKLTLKSFVFPASVTSIGDNAFKGCSGFTGSLTIPSSVTSIAYMAFYGCSGFTGSLTIPASVTSIGGWAFAKCSGFMGSLTIPASVTSIRECAFYNCTGFTGSLTIPASVTSIGDYAFFDCGGFTGSLTIPASVTSIGDYAFFDCSGFTGSLTIPSSVTYIGKRAFYGCSGFMGSLTIPSSVTSISVGAFSGCRGFTGSLNIPALVTSIGISAFNGCSGFTDSLNIPSSVTSIEDGAFVSCGGIFNVDSNNLNFSSVDGVLYNKNETTLIQCPTSKTGRFVVIPASVTSIDGWAFYNCSGLTGSLIIPASITFIGNLAFKNCSGLTSILTHNSAPIDLSQSVNVFGNVNNTNCKLLVPIGSGAAYKSANQWKDFINIIEVDFDVINQPGKLATTYTSAELASMTTLTLEGNIDARDFKIMRDDMPKLTSIDLSNATIVEYTGILGTLSKDITTYSANQIPADAFFNAELNMGKSELSSVILPTTITSIDSSAFNGCSGLTTVSIPTSVTSLGTKAFANCLGLQKIYVYETTPLDLTNSATVFAGVNKRTCELHIPDGTLAIYRAANQWGEFIKLRESDTALKTIEDVSVTVFPNPVKENFRVTGLDGVFTVTLLDITGNTVLTQEASANESISMSSFPAGSYLLLIKTERGTICKMITKR
ncbi:MAG: leucine-rich repeat protein [Breznakibacter sp.]|nr:leucine-rich repeat protein [Breznakibacter sp.]